MGTELSRCVSLSPSPWVRLPDTALIPLVPRNTMTSRRLCCLNGDFDDAETILGSRRAQPRHASAAVVFFSLFSTYSVLSFPCACFYLPVPTLSNVLYSYFFLLPVPHSVFCSLCRSVFPRVFCGLIKRLDQTIRRDTWLKTHLEKGIIFSHGHNFN